MTTRFSLIFAGLALAGACANDKSDRDSQIGRTTYDGSEDMVPASSTAAPRPERGSPGLANDAAMKATPAPEPPVSTMIGDADDAADEGVTRPSEAGAPDAGAKRTPDVVFIPTPQPVVDKMLELAKITKNDVVYDLGCGDGRILVTAAKRYFARGVGFDIDPERVSEARNNVSKNKLEPLVSIQQQDIFTVDLTPATVVTLYLLPKLNDRLLPQLERLRTGARVVSHDYGISGVVPERHLEVRVRGDERIHEIYFYTIPFKRSPVFPKPTSVPPPTVP